MLREKLWTMVDQYEKPFKVGMYLVVIVLMAGIVWVRAAPPSNTISYQGYLTDTAGRAVSGNLNMNVAFYDAATGGANPYAEDHANVTVARGRFDLELGAGTATVGTWGALDFSQALWMEIAADGETFAPRIPFSAVPYARFAFQSQQIGTLTAARWCTSDGNVINCTQSPPPDEVGAVTLNNWCRGDGSAVQCDQSAPTDEVGAVTNNQWCRGDGSAVQCDQTAPADEVGAVTNNQWCRGDGSAVQCDQSAPTDEVGTLTPNKWCAANAGGTMIDCTQDAPSGGLSVTVRTSTASALNHYVACSGGETVIGGGCEPSSSLWESCPATNSTTCSTSPTGWRCGQNVAGNVTVYVICSQ